MITLECEVCNDYVTLIGHRTDDHTCPSCGGALVPKDETPRWGDEKEQDS